MPDDGPFYQQSDAAPSYAAPLAGFRSRKAAQLSAYFAVQSAGVIEKLKLIKLVYLTERRFLERHDHPMLFDELYSLPHGPICSSTLNGIDGIIHSATWDRYIARNGNLVVALKKFKRDAFDELSNAEIREAQMAWRRFGKMTASQIRNFTHDHCPEYTETEKDRIPISYRQLLEALGKEDAEDIDREIGEIRRIVGLLAG
jgi:uncharacterized phage-associated protein